MVFLGIDNGVSSSGCAVLADNKPAKLYPLPIKKELSYTKKVKNITRIDFPKLLNLFQKIKSAHPEEQFLVGLERPMINAMRFNASLSAIRCLEATIIAVELVEFPYVYIDSKEWQKMLLPKGIKGSTALKEASKNIGQRLFPNVKIKKDADSLLIAEYLKRKHQKYA